MTNDRLADAAAKIFAAGTGAHYDDIVARTTRGNDHQWKLRLLDRLTPPRRVLDLACGTGLLTFALRDRFPETEVVGVEVNAEYLAVARQRREERGDDSVEFIRSRAEEAPLTGSFDAIVTCYLPKYADLEQLIPRLIAHLEPGGQLLMHDFVYPSDPIVARAWRWGFRRNREWAEEHLPSAVAMFDELPALISESRWVEELTQLLSQHGLTKIATETLSHGQAAIVSAESPAPPSP